MLQKTDNGEGLSTIQRINNLNGMLNDEGDGQKTQGLKQKLKETKQNINIMQQTNEIRLKQIKQEIQSINNNKTITKLTQNNDSTNITNNTQLMINHQLSIGDIVDKSTQSVNRDIQGIQNRMKKYKQQILKMKMQVVQDNQRFQAYSALIKQENQQSVFNINRKVSTNTNRLQVTQSNLKLDANKITNAIQQQQNKDQQTTSNIHNIIQQLKQTLINSIKQQNDALQQNYESHYKVLQKTIQVLATQLQ